MQMCNFNEIKKNSFHFDQLRAHFHMLNTLSAIQRRNGCIKKTKPNRDCCNVFYLLQSRFWNAEVCVFHSSFSVAVARFRKSVFFALAKDILACVLNEEALHHDRYNIFLLSQMKTNQTN